MSHGGWTPRSNYVGMVPTTRTTTGGTAAHWTTDTCALSPEWMNTFTVWTNCAVPTCWTSNRSFNLLGLLHSSCCREIWKGCTSAYGYWASPHPSHWKTRASVCPQHQSSPLRPPASTHTSLSGCPNLSCPSEERGGTTEGFQVQWALCCLSAGRGRSPVVTPARGRGKAEVQTWENAPSRNNCGISLACSFCAFLCPIYCGNLHEKSNSVS